MNILEYFEKRRVEARKNKIDKLKCRLANAKERHRVMTSFYSGQTIKGYQFEDYVKLSGNISEMEEELKILEY